MIKWAAFITGFIIYVLFNSWQGKRARRTKDLSQDVVSTAKLTSDAPDEGVKANDPFHDIRQKDKLRSKADMIIEKNS